MSDTPGRPNRPPVFSAAATGLPVLAPARRGPLDLVEHRVSGFLFDPALPGDLGSWVAVVEQLLAHYGAVARGDSSRAA